jgi:hypothetical protein
VLPVFVTGNARSQTGEAAMDSFEIEGFEMLGLEMLGFEIDGFEMLGFEMLGFEMLGFEMEGFEIEGFDTDAVCVSARGSGAPAATADWRRGTVGSALRTRKLARPPATGSPSGPEISATSRRIVAAGSAEAAKIVCDDPERGGMSVS